MNKLLKQVAEVQMGYSFRSRVEASQNEGTAIIQMKDLLPNNTVSHYDLMRINMRGFKEHHFVREGDLVFRSRGQATPSAVVLDDLDNTIVSAPLLRIRVTDTNSVSPKYLNWFINQHDAQKYFQSRAKGTVQKMISKQAVGDMSVTLPPIELQIQIVEISKLADREQELLRELAEKRDQYISTILMKYAKGVSNNE